MEKKPKVLFLSTGDSTRGQMAQGILRTSAGDRFDAMSAGIESGEVNLLAAEVMREIGIDISSQRSNSLHDLFKEQFRFVITLYDKARERAPVFPFTPHLLQWSLEDASAAEGSTEEKKQAFRRVRDDLQVKVQTFLNEAVQKYQTAST